MAKKTSGLMAPTKKKVKNKVLTVEDLGKGIVAGKLDDTVINR